MREKKTFLPYIECQLISTSGVMVTENSHLVTTIIVINLGKNNQCSLSQMGFPGGSDGKESACDVGDLGSIPGSGRSSGEGNGYTLQCSCLENPRDRGAWWARAAGVTSKNTTQPAILSYANSNFT